MKIRIPVLGRAVFEEKPLPINDRDAKLEQLESQMAEITNIIDTLENSGIDVKAREDIDELNTRNGRKTRPSRPNSVGYQVDETRIKVQCRTGCIYQAV